MIKIDDSLTPQALVPAIGLPPNYPFHLLECCLVTDGGGSLVVTSAERAGSFPKPAVHVLDPDRSVAAAQPEQRSAAVQGPANIVVAHAPQ